MNLDLTASDIYLSLKFNCEEFSRIKFYISRPGVRKKLRIVRTSPGRP